MSERLQWAKEFVESGYAIIPIDPQSKKPVIKEWEKYSTQPLSDEDKQKFLKMVEDGYNYAVVCGQHGLVVLDFENKELLKSWIGESVVNDICSKTLCVDTPHGGLHIYLISNDIPPHKFNPAFVKDNETVMDLQSYKSYVLGPESCINHKNCSTDKCPWRGQDYTTCYTAEMPLGNVILGSDVDLKGLLKFFIEKGKKLGIEPSARLLEWLGDEVKKEDEKLEKLKEEMAKYDRFKGKTVEAIREEVCKEISKELEELKGKDDKKSKKWSAILTTAESAVCEGKTYAEIGIDRSRGDWAFYYVLFSHGATNLDVLEQLLPSDSKVFAPKWDKYYVHTVKKVWEKVKPLLEFQAQVKGKKEKEAKKIAKSIITGTILRLHKIKTFYQVTGHNQAVIGVFKWDKKKGVYTPFDKGLRKEIREIAEMLEIRSRDKTLAQLSKRDVDDIFDEIKDLTLTPLPKEPLRIAFKNGTLEWTEKGIIWYDAKERSPKVYSFYYLPWEVKVEEIEKFMNKEITVKDIEELASRLCPKSLETFKQWVDDKWVLLFEIIGYTLYPEIKFRKAFMVIGSGGNGKSTYINLIKKILGDYAVSISPRELFDPQNRFIAGNLYHKLANAVAESKNYTIEDMDRFKRLTGGDWITADVKFKDPITFKNIAKLIIASNNMPAVRDTDDKAFWHRWVLVEFPHEFKDNDTWFDKVFTEEEINGIVTTSIMAISRAFQMGHFDFEQNEKEVMDLWLSHIDSVYSFVKTYAEKGILTVDPKNGDLVVEKKRLYKMYRDYCNTMGFRGVGPNSFSRKLRTYFNISTDRKVVGYKDGKPIRRKFLVGIGINELEAYRQLNHETTIDEIKEFLNYIKENNNTIKEFTDIVKDFGDRDKANKFVKFCQDHRFCEPRGMDIFEIHLD
ncbi:phage/plasmid primase, P4 family [Sulfurisphaera tokodaii]|uniref:Replication protein n=2 Tax=Sulfurisphaera tokodaii TaxID=111955 RepID=Q973E3_SULTO|nr:phage/plasmid primase, P4 family [Sulfurisphaera tokodaii]BAB65970.1 replication protein [Sulfurisphaera tokodaii str. 7]HII73928.1 DNA primase [Sulfurisphaera tokodaii]